MEVINPRSALLSNYEVLNLLRELESDHLAKTRTALRIKKEEEASGSANKTHIAQEEVVQNLRTIEIEAIQYLSANYQPTASQSETGITQLTQGLGAYDLTKAEKLQIVNLAPTEPVELYVIIEELEDRFGEQIDDMLATVRASLSESSGEPAGDAAAAAGEAQVEQVVFAADTFMDEPWEQDANDVEFDDTGEGAGIEGDLDVDDD